MSWDEWHTMDDMYTYLDYLATTFPWVTVESLGQSFEGQDMRVAKVRRITLENIFYTFYHHTRCVGERLGAVTSLRCGWTAVSTPGSGSAPR